MKKVLSKIAAIAVCVVLACTVLVACAPAAPAVSEASATEAPASEVSTLPELEEEKAVADLTDDPAGVPSTLPELEEEQAVADLSPTGGLQAIKDRGKLIMLTNATFPPYEYLGEGASVIGADVDIAQMIADEIGVPLEVVDMDFDGLPIALNNGKGDLVAAGMTITPEREEAITFSIPYTDATQLIIVNKDEPKVSSPKDFEGKTIGVQLGTTGDIYLQYEIDGGANITVKQYKSNMDAAMDLLNGRLDAIVLDEMPAKSIVSANEDKLAVIEEPFTEEEYAMAVAKGNTELAEVVDRILLKLVEEKQVQPLIQKHAENYAAINQ